MTTTIHPAFDPVTGTWFCAEFKAEAPTIRLLLAKIRASVLVLDYYPGGLSATVAGQVIENEMRRARAEAPRAPEVPGRGNPAVSRKNTGNDAYGRPPWKKELANHTQSLAKKDAPRGRAAVAAK